MIDLSIIVTTHNTEKYILNCLQSILSIIDKNVQLIIIDDCSKDNTIKLCENLLRKTQNNLKYKISLIKFNKNMGVSYSRNYGINVSIGKYIWFVDGDDLVTTLPINDSIIKNDFDIVFFRTSTYKNEKITHIPFPKIHTANVNTTLQLQLSGVLRYPVWSKIFKRQFLVKNHVAFRDYNDVYAEDLLFSLTCISKAKKFYYSYHIPYIFNVHDDSTYESNKFRDHTEQLKCFVECFENDSNKNFVFFGKFIEMYFHLNKNDEHKNNLAFHYYLFKNGYINNLYIQYCSSKNIKPLFLFSLASRFANFYLLKKWKYYSS